MLILLSPAKSLDFSAAEAIPARGRPRFEDKTEKLVGQLSKMSKPKLKSIMPVSDNLLTLNHSRYTEFFEQPEKPAIHAYSGDVYTGFEAKSLDEDALDYAQNHVRILSGLYGLLRPYDAIRPHRLEMGTKWAPGRARKLTDFWGETIARRLAADAEQNDAPLILNLASQEYWAAVKPYADKLGRAVIDVDFRQRTASGPKFNSFAAKRARGMMARYVCEHRVETAEPLKSFDSDGYRFAGREDDTLRFLRD